MIFHNLTPEQLNAIVDIQLKHLQKRLDEQHLTLELSEAAKALLAREGYDPTYGARPLKRAIQKQVENPLAMEILEGHFSTGGDIWCDVKDGKITFQSTGTVRTDD